MSATVDRSRAVGGLTPYDRAERGALLGLWLIAEAPINQPYPCRCVLGRRCETTKRLCRCAGRTDLDVVPAHCCGHYNTPEVVAAAVAADQWLHWR